MKDQDNTKDESIDELENLRRRVSELEESEARLKRTERLLRESEERFRLLYENAPLGYQSLDENGFLLEINPAWSDLLGYGREEVIGKWVGDFLTASYREKFLIYFPQFKAAGEIHGVEFEMLKRGGAQITVAVDGRIGHDEQGKFKRTHCILHDITERKRAEEARERSEKIYRQMFEGSRAVKLLIDPESGAMVDANPAAEHFYGYALDDLKRMRISDINTLPAEQIFAEMTEAKTGRRQHFFFKHRLASGEIRDVEVHSSPLDLGDNRILYSIIHDITERKKLEGAADRANQEWERTFTAISDPVMVLDDQHKILRANKAMADALGMTQQELTGKFCFELVHGQTTPPVFCPHVQLLTDGAEHSAEVVEPRLGGIYDVRVSPLVGQHGQVIGSVHVTRDITERKRTERELQKSNDLLRAVIEAAPTAIIGLDLDGNVQMVWNPAAEKMLGWSAHEVMGRSLPSVPVESQEEFRSFRERIRSGKTLDGVEVRRQRRDGTPIDYSIYASPLHDAEGRITGNICVLVDITERKQAEEENKKLQAQLLLAQKMEAIGTLAGGIAHDFNNLLQVVLGYSDMLLFNKKPTDREYEGLHAIRQAGRDGGELAKRILAFSRRLEPNARPVNLNNEINRLEKMLKRTVPRMIRIELHLADDLMTVNADPGQMEQILLNLAVNAQHAMPDGGRLTIETANVTLDEAYSRTHLDVEPRKYVLLTVSDTGHGMDEEVVEHIFEPFYTTKGPGEGTGLGLAMVFGIVKSHKGHITCYSEPGTGTTFKIYLPAIVQDMEQDVAVTQQMPAFGTETILLVDDEKSIRKLGEQMLTMAGYHVLTAANGREALEVYRSNKDSIALVLLDLIMPEMGGKKCLEGLLKINQKVKVVIASGYSANGPTKDALASGARGFVNKPYDLRQVLEVVRRVLDAG